jgi:hypothetical protein
MREDEQLLDWALRLIELAVDIMPQHGTEDLRAKIDEGLALMQRARQTRQQ